MFIQDKLYFNNNLCLSFLSSDNILQNIVQFINNNLKIVIPAYKSEKWVTNTIRSVKGQSYTNFKCIFIDDNSPDDTFNVAKKAIEEDERFILWRNAKTKFNRWYDILS